MIEHVPPPRRAAIRRALLKWYDRNKRDLPWRRREGNAYAQWVAEVMLQQTRVETVLDYYNKFLRRFPNPTRLADASDHDLKTQWQGLGYYRRADHLKKAARMLADSGRPLPTTAHDWQALPGVGRYTAGAIASIANNERVAAVDGNVARIVARLFEIRDNILEPKTLDIVWQIAEQIVPRSRPGDFNQAWMDLGATVCTPRNPRCSDCPLSKYCRASRNNQTNEIPFRESRTKVIRLHEVAIHASCGNRVFMRRRPENGLWSGLWELPAIEIESGPGRTKTLVVAKKLSADISHNNKTHAHRLRHLGISSHRLTHRIIQTDLFGIRFSGWPENWGEFPNRRWVTPSQLRDLPTSTSTKKLLKLVNP
jgi:A/G-specific adenine glycosylase